MLAGCDDSRRYQRANTAPEQRAADFAACNPPGATMMDNHTCMAAKGYTYRR